MDNSETYIKMCEKAEEIQVLRREEHNSDTGKWKPGDFWIHVAGKNAHIVDEYKDAWADIPLYIHHPIECIWLPRQDQLQEMIMDEETDYLCLALNFSDWLKSILWNFEMNSMEQLWLAFVMKEKYGKVWNGEHWIRANDKV